MPVRTEVAMGTLVTIRVLRSGTEAMQALDRAFAWFHEIEDRTTRFNPASELRQLTAQTGVAVPASPILYQAVQFALMVAESSGGAFDPTVGRQMEARGFNREYRTGDITGSGGAINYVSYRDLQLDPERKSITLLRPLTLDLGAVVKGLAVDMAAHELQPFRDFAVDAGGDLYLGGCNERGSPWRIGIRHPRQESGLIATVYASDQAVCTSGDYERRRPSVAARHGAAPSIIFWTRAQEYLRVVSRAQRWSLPRPCWPTRRQRRHLSLDPTVALSSWTGLGWRVCL